jgi:magnesium transporter
MRVSSTMTVRWLDGDVLRAGSLDDLDRARESGGLMWVDLEHPTLMDFEPLVALFDLHPLAVEDCLHFPQRPKMVAYDHTTFVIWLVPHVLDEVESREIDAFLGSDFVITVHHDASPTIERVAKHVDKDLFRGNHWLLHAILDTAVDGFMPVIDNLVDELDELEDEVLEDPTHNVMHRLHSARRRLIDLHRVVRPERDLVRELARRAAVSSTEIFMYYEDVGDHLARVVDEIETLRDVAAAVTDIHLSVVSNRMNEVMKQLTLVATIFMPLTLISGIYGMNFHWMPELAWRWGYPLVVLTMLVISAVMYRFFKKREWI